jgi:hypothetical protein
MTLPVPTLQPIYYSAQDLKRMEVMARDHVFDHGYNSRAVGLSIKECPPFLTEMWSGWGRVGWRERRDEERKWKRRQKRKHR